MSKHFNLTVMMGGSSFLVSDESSQYLSQGSTFIKCSSCDKCFTSILTLNKHEVWHHKSLFLRFKHNCESCPYATNNKTNFKKHLEVHSLDRRFCCSLCNNRFKNIGSLNNHMIIHTGEENLC
ncbi:hypothetical protein CEXT_64941 [Caerostris extrusa]|uniref:C2H2-type domain-containing protein n=1 Tax=Caerostris extrusa TaxID=172846 RepID=A0AAV4T032_CAEEX|nr:hypothetical protein CEXT_64941 [Caerostris extrusa]